MNALTPPMPTEFLQVWNLLNLSYPTFCREAGPEALKATLQLYHQLLSDMPGELLRAAALRHVSSSRFFPAVAELREAAIALGAGLQPSAAEAWGEVLDAMARVEHYCYTDHVNEPQFANPVTARLVRSLSWRNLCLSENAIADRARFVDAYTQLAARAERERGLPPQLQAGAQAAGQLASQVADRLTAGLASR